MKVLIAFLLLTAACFGQWRSETVSFSDTTASAVIDVPNSAYYLAGIAKPDSGGNIITFDAELSASGTDQYSILTAVADSAYTVTLPDSTNAYSVPLPRDIFEKWQFIRIKFAKATTVDMTIIWKRK